MASKVEEAQRFLENAITAFSQDRMEWGDGDRADLAYADVRRWIGDFAAAVREEERASRSHPLTCRCGKTVYRLPASVVEPPSCPLCP